MIQRHRLQAIALAVVLALAAGVSDTLIAHAQAPRGDGQVQMGKSGVNQRGLVDLLKAMRDRVIGITATGGAALSVGSTAAKVRTNGIINYGINGAMLGKGSTDDFCTLAGTATTTTTGAYYRFEIDAAGNCSVTQGPIAAVASGTLNGVIIMPSRSASKATLGVLLVAGQAFTPGTTTTAASATVVYTNGDPDLASLLEP